jgi:hypothetical protein
MNGPIEPQCYITLGWKGFPGTNNLAYWAYSISWSVAFVSYGENKMNETRGCVHNTSFSS